MNLRQVEAMVKDMSRENIQQILEAHGFAVYDSEKLSDLRKALIENIKDNTIPQSVLQEFM